MARRAKDVFGGAQPRQGDDLKVKRQGYKGQELAPLLKTVSPINFDAQNALKLSAGCSRQKEAETNRVDAFFLLASSAMCLKDVASVSTGGG
jgi:hypothetical protein